MSDTLNELIDELQIERGQLKSDLATAQAKVKKLETKDPLDIVITRTVNGQSESYPIRTLIGMLEEQLAEAVRIIRQGKVQFAPNTTNSDVDVFLAKHKEV